MQSLPATPLLTANARWKYSQLTDSFFGQIGVACTNGDARLIRRVRFVFQDRPEAYLWDWNRRKGLEPVMQYGGNNYRYVVLSDDEAFLSALKDPENENVFQIYGITANDWTKYAGYNIVPPASCKISLWATVRSDALDEPALVIPLSTTIEFAKNFFGHDLAGGDHQFSPSYFATKIAEAGVELVGYNVGRDGGRVTAFAETPYVYLVPAGLDRMRAPATGEVISFDVADQLLEVPNLLGSKALAMSWDALYANLMGQGTAATVRKYPPFRANGESDATTLIGRSVWNTQWVLVIPAGAIRSDRAKVLEELVWGNEETAGVTDIKIGFRTYSHWGK